MMVVRQLPHKMCNKDHKVEARKFIYSAQMKLAKKGRSVWVATRGAEDILAYWRHRERAFGEEEVKADSTTKRRERVGKATSGAVIPLAVKASPDVPHKPIIVPEERWRTEHSYRTPAREAIQDGDHMLGGGCPWEHA
jgi:hypothetical protein